MQRMPAFIAAALAACTVVACDRDDEDVDVRARAAETTSAQNVRGEVLQEQADELRDQADLAERIAKKRGDILDSQAKVLDQQARIDRQRAELQQLEALQARQMSERDAAVRAGEAVMEAPRPAVEQAPTMVPTERIEIEPGPPVPVPSTSPPPAPSATDAAPPIID
jgi:hypothetical protein